MSDDQNLDLLAAEYVLGSLEDEERREAERLLASDPAFADSVAAWQQRLTPLAARVAPVPPPPDLWGRIEANIAPTARVPPFRLHRRAWRAAAGAALALAAGLGAFIVLPHRERPDQPDRQGVAMQSPLPVQRAEGRDQGVAAQSPSPVQRAEGNDQGVAVRSPSPLQRAEGSDQGVAAQSASPVQRAEGSDVRAPARSRMAMLSPAAGGSPAFTARLDKDGGLAVWPTGSIPVPDDKDLELWAIPPGETRPSSLGVLPPSGTKVTAVVAPDTQLLVSMEPKGGSPTGQPTGPVLYVGWLKTAE